MLERGIFRLILIHSDYLLMNWTILYYETLQGNSPVYDFIDKLHPKIQAKVANTFDLLEQYGTLLGAPHVKKITSYSFWELRILGTDNVRIFYVAYTEKTFLLLHGFLKKKQKTDKKELKVAQERLSEYKSRVKLRR
jgi:phage-related protein